MICIAWQGWRFRCWDVYLLEFWSRLLLETGKQPRKCKRVYCMGILVHGKELGSHRLLSTSTEDNETLLRGVRN